MSSTLKIPRPANQNRIAIVILAAGASTRLGTAKQLLKANDSQTLLKRAATTALSTTCRPVVVVLGANHEAISKELSGLDLFIAINAQWQTGIASSVKHGLQEVLRLQADTDALIFMVCDQPYVTTALLEALMAQYHATGKNLVASRYDEATGTPALFDHSFFPLLERLEGDKGALKLIHQFPEQLGFVPFAKGIFDIDTAEDYRRYSGNKE